MESDDVNLLESNISCGESQPFIPLKSLWLTVIHLVFTISLICVAVGLTIGVDLDRFECQPVLSILLFYHAGFWCISWATYVLFKREHLNLKRNGYFEFLKIANHYASIPHKISSLWNSILMVLVGIYNIQHTMFGTRCDSEYPLSPMNIIMILLIIECVLITYYLAMYCIKVQDFNKKKPTRDIELNCNWSLNEHFPTSELGYREKWELIENLLEKQADIIMHFSNLNKNLNKKILHLMNNQKRNSS